jgi:hypothetical protein
MLRLWVNILLRFEGNGYPKTQHNFPQDFPLQQTPLKEHLISKDAFLFPTARQPPVGPRPPHYRGFTITLWHTTLGRTPLDEWSARHRDLYLTKHNIQQQTDIYAASGIRTRNPTKRAAADPRLRRRGYWNRRKTSYDGHIPILTVLCSPPVIIGQYKPQQSILTVSPLQNFLHAARSVSRYAFRHVLEIYLQ